MALGGSRGRPRRAAKALPVPNAKHLPLSRPHNQAHLDGRQVLMGPHGLVQTCRSHRVSMQPLMSPPWGLPDRCPCAAARPCPSAEHLLPPLRAHRLWAPHWLQGRGPQAAPGPECGRNEAVGGERPSRRRAGAPQGLEKGASPGWRAQCRPWGHHVASVVLSPCGALEVDWRPPQKHGREPVPSRGWGSNSGFTFG